MHRDREALTIASDFADWEPDYDLDEADDDSEELDVYDIEDLED